MLVGVGTGILALLATVWLMVVWHYRDRLVRLWREPVLRQAVIIFESDDWGPGPETHAEALNRLRVVLNASKDWNGSHPVATLGIILATADVQRMRDAHGDYYRKGLEAPEFAGIRRAIEHGRRQGVFSLQLHGMEHFWPAAVCQAASSQPEVAAWLQSIPPADPQRLPPHLQSRWVNAATLPSSPIDSEETVRAAREEVETFEAVFGVVPSVGVPPTFVWDDPVEESWGRAGVRTVVTPGTRYTSRNAKGQPDGAAGPIYSGEQAASGALYLVRDVYFEPSRGHTAEYALDQIRARILLGRPALIEMHRENFTGESETADRAFSELERLLDLIRAKFPKVRFMSTEALAECYRRRDDVCFDKRRRRRLHVWLTRLNTAPRLRRLSLLSGLAAPAALIWALTRQ